MVDKNIRKETRGGALGRVQNLRRQYCWVTQVNLISYSLNMMSTVLSYNFFDVRSNIRFLMGWYRIIVETSGLRRYLVQRQLLLDNVRGQVDDFVSTSL